MKLLLHCLLFSFLIITVFSCARPMQLPRSNFQKLDKNVAKINALYINSSITYGKLQDQNSVLANFNIQDKANIVQLHFVNNKTLQLSYYTPTDSGTTYKTATFHGKLKNKYFQIYLKKQRLNIPFIYGYSYIDRIRIGQTINNELIVATYHENTGYVFLLAAGSSYHSDFVYEQLNAVKNFYSYYDVAQKSWGIINNSDSMLHKDYSYIAPAVGNTVIVYKDTLQALLNNEDEILSKYWYQQIKLVKNKNVAPYYQIKQNNQWGTMDTLGKEIVAPQYDHIDEDYGRGYRIKHENKFGFVNPNGSIIPPIFDSYFWYTDKYVLKQKYKLAEVKLKETTFFVDEWANIYESKEIKGALYNIYIPIIESKQSLEEFMK